MVKRNGLSPEIEDFTRDSVASSSYSNAIDVLRMQTIARTDGLARN